MKKSVIVAFVSAVRRAFMRYIDMRLTVGAPVIANDADCSAAASGIIALGGTINGTLCLRLPAPTAEALARRINGDAANTDDDHLAGAVARLSTHIADEFRSALHADDLCVIDPVVVIGPSHRLHRQGQAPTIALACRCDAGPCRLEARVWRTRTVTPGLHRTTAHTEVEIVK